MLGSLARKIFGTTNERIVKAYQSRVNAINALEPELQTLSDEALKAKTSELREKIKNGASLDDVLPEAFATVREASVRTLGMRHFDVQLIGGMVLHEGKISEMKTGEGKTLVATLAAYLNALQGKGVHIVTVNDYLAKRDSAWMGAIYQFLGLRVGVIVHDMSDEARQVAYRCDITYGTNNEYGFDYLRGNMKYSRASMAQRDFNYAIVDEVDSILIDEARTPLIISGPTEDNSALYVQVDKLIREVAKDDYEVDEKVKSVALNEQGIQKMEQLLAGAGLMEAGTSLYDIGNISVVHHVNQALRAHVIFHRDVDYVVKDNKIVIVDEFTGRMMEGRRYSEGLHQALEAKERVTIQNENQTLASITFQNYFRLYPKLAGMTGTAMTEADEFSDIYGLEVVEVPTHMAVARVDCDDEIYRTAEEKNNAVIELIKECYGRKQPVLVGTVSIEKSELLAAMLKKEKIPHHVLNARYHEQEAYIIAQAGKPGAVTIATNMAGRGTDIKLGGNVEMRIEEAMKRRRPDSERSEEEGSHAARDPSSPTAPQDDEYKTIAERIEREIEAAKQEVINAGGLYVIGTERHESRRIDNQLRGRSGRQGDPGASKFFISLQDDLMRIFGSERIDGMLQRLGLKEGEAIIHPWMNKALERAQGKVEARNYEIRKNLLKFDNVMNDQRKVIYEQRLELMDTTDVSETVAAMRSDVCHALVTGSVPPKSYPDQWDTETLEKELFRIFGLHIPVHDWAKEEGIADEEILERIKKAAADRAAAKEADYGPDMMRIAEKRLLLQTLDQLWKDHLLSLDHLRSGIHLRGYGQRDPLNEYKQEAFSLFEHMLNHLREVVTERLAHLTIRMEMPPEALATIRQTQPMNESRLDPAEAQFTGNKQQVDLGRPVHTRTEAAERKPHDPATWGRVGRNEPCPCSSGEKYKHCHGKLA